MKHKQEKKFTVYPQVVKQAAMYENCQKVILREIFFLTTRKRFSVEALKSN